MRRLRTQGWIREMVQEHRLHPSDLIWPVFVVDETNIQEDIVSLPGVSRWSIDLLIEEVKKAVDLGIPAIALFPVIEIEKKCENGAEALNPDNLICRAIQAIKKAAPDIGIIADVALDPYTTHGHDGILRESAIVNDETNTILSEQSVVLAEAGADIIAPSDMMDGRVGVIREALENKSSQDILILSYAAKFASGFYGPFRDAIGSKNNLKSDKKTYQMNSPNIDEALREVALDIAEGTDMIMVKPGLPYLDIIHRVKNTYKVPTFAYHVSGEYAMLRAAAQNGWLDYETCLYESILSFKRAGCDGILTYGAVDLAQSLNS